MGKFYQSIQSNGPSFMTKFCSALYLENLLTNIFAKLNLRGGVSCMPAALLLKNTKPFKSFYQFKKNISAHCIHIQHKSGLMGKPTICIGAFVFATRIVQFLFYLNPKFQASSSFLRQYRSVCVGPVRKPHCWFSHEAAHKSSEMTS